MEKNKVNHEIAQYPVTIFHRWGAKRFHIMVKFFAKHHVDPNWFTYVGLLFAVAVCVSLWQGWWWSALLFITINGLSDVIDGELARAVASGRPDWLKEYGELLDPKIDRVNDIMAFLGLWLYAQSIGLPVWYQLIILLSGMLHPVSSYIRAKYESLSIFQNRKILFQEKKPLTRAAFMIFLSIICLLLGLAEFQSFQLDEKIVIYWIFSVGIMVLVCLPTLINFFRRWHRSRRIFRLNGMTPPHL